MANKELNIGIKVDSSQLNQTVQKVGELKQLSKGISIQYDINGKPLDVVIDKSLNLQKQVRLLTAELRKTKEGTDEFALLSSRLNDAKDNLERVSAKSRDLFAALSLLPGPVGSFFGQLNGAVGLMKTFTGFSLKDLGNQFKELKNDLFDIYRNLFGAKQASDELTKSGDNLAQSQQRATTNINSAATSLKTYKEAAQEYTKQTGKAVDETVNFDRSTGKIVSNADNMTTAIKTVNQTVNQTTKSFGAATIAGNLLGKTMTFVGISFETAAVAVGIFEAALAALGIGVVIAGLVALYDILKETVTGWWDNYWGITAAKKALDEANASIQKTNEILDLDLKAQKRRNDEYIALLKSRGASEKQINKATIEGLKERLALTETALGEISAAENKALKEGRVTGEEYKKIVENRTKLEEQAKDLRSQIKVEEYNITAQTNKKIQEENEKARQKELDDARTAAQMLLELRKENALASIKDERERQYKELELQAATEVDKVNALRISEEKKLELRNQIFLKFAKKQIELNKKFNDEDIKKAEETAKKKEEILDKINQYSIDAITDQRIKERAERQKKFDDELKDLDKALKDKLITQKQYDDAVKMMKIALDNDLKKIDDDARQREKEAQLKKLDEDIRFLQIMNEANIRTFGAYWDGRKELLKKAKERELLEIGDNEEKKHAIEKKYVTLFKSLQQEKLQAVLGYVNSTLGVVSGFLQQQQTINNLAMDVELAKYKDNAVEQDKIKEKYFYKNRDAQQNQARIGAFQAAIQAYTSLAGIPVVGPVLGAAAAAAALLFGFKQVKLIGQQTYQGSSSGGSDSGGAKPELPNYLRNYEDGGMIGGKRHAEGGTIIEAERGEAIMTRGAVTMFKPLLSLMNQAGGGVAFNSNLTTTSFDNPKVSTPQEDNKPMIIKSYVVSNELTNEQQRQARLKDLSTL